MLISADVLFARRGLRLEEYCIQNKISHIPFDTFKDIEHEVARIVKDDRKSKRETGVPKFYNPRYVQSSRSMLTAQSKLLEEVFEKKIRAFFKKSFRCSHPQRRLQLSQGEVSAGWEFHPSTSGMSCMRDSIPFIIYRIIMDWCLVKHTLQSERGGM